MGGTDILTSHDGFSHANSSFQLEVTFRIEQGIYGQFYSAVIDPTHTSAGLVHTRESIV